MEKRDWFAATALLGFLMQNRAGKPEQYAEAAYQYADMMVEASGDAPVEDE
jgi:hypothetical protein